MNGSTHVKFAIASALATTVLAPDLDIAPLICGSIFGGLLPDIDSGGSIGKYFPITNTIFTKLAEKKFVPCFHRHITHSFLFFPLIFFFVLKLAELPAAFHNFLVGMLIGVLSHIILDVLIGNTWALYPFVKTPFNILCIKRAENPEKYEQVDRFFGFVGYLCCAVQIPLLYWILQTTI